MKGVCFVADSFVHLQLSPGIALQVLAVLAVNSIQLSLCAALREHWVNKEVAEHIKSSFKMAFVYIKMIVRIFNISVGVGAPAVLGQVR